jgi:hypothetical protein
VSALYKEGGHAFPATLALVIDIIYLAVALLSGNYSLILGYLYFLVWKKRSLLAKAFL